jgi:hypothetical protein
LGDGFAGSVCVDGIEMCYMLNALVTIKYFWQELQPMLVYSANVVRNSLNAAVRKNIMDVMQIVFVL